MSPPALAGTAPCTAGTAVGCAPDAVFKQAFNVYRTIVDAGLLGHSTLASAAVSQLRAAQKGSFPGAPLSLLDAGCGDAGALAAALKDAGGASLVSAYHGLDASAPALAAALPTVEAALGPAARAAVAVGDLLTHLEGAAAVLKGEEVDVASVAAMPPPPGGYHAIVATLAVHHLDTDAKARWVAAAAGCLAPGGVLVVGDVFLENDADSVPAWRSRSTARMREAWPAVSGLPQAECDGLAAHVGACDMPETVAAYEAMMTRGGLSRFSVAARVDPGACGGAVIPCTTVAAWKEKKKGEGSPAPPPAFRAGREA